MVRSYFYYLSISILTWITTNALGASVIAWNNTFGLRFLEAMILSLLLSAPAVFGLVASCYHLTTIRDRRRRIILALLENIAIVILVDVCFLILAWRFNDAKYFLRGYPSTFADYVMILLPFAISAPLCFMLIANKLVFSSKHRYPLLSS
jgi:hypothetical protein